MSFVMRARAPRAPAPASALLQPALQPPPPSPVPGPEWRVLIVDSDPDVHAAFRLALETVQTPLRGGSLEADVFGHLPQPESHSDFAALSETQHGKL